MGIHVTVKMVSMVCIVRTTSTTALQFLAQTMASVAMVSTISPAYVRLVLRVRCATWTLNIAPPSLAIITVHVLMTTRLLSASVPMVLKGSTAKSMWTIAKILPA